MYLNKFSKKRFFVLVVVLFSLIILLFIAGRANPTVSFEDSGLEDVIREKLDRSKGPIYKTDLAIITDLDASNKNIKTLDGIENLTRLAKLNLENNTVKDLSQLSNIKTLKELNLRNNEITNLDDIKFEAIKNLPLRELNLRHNVKRRGETDTDRLTDIELLKNFRELEKLELRDNTISDLSPIKNLTNLEELDIRENEFKKIDDLINLKKLEKLNLRDNDIKSIEALSNLTNLKYLNIHSDALIKTVEPIKNLVNLETLIMKDVEITNNVDIFENLTKLQRLNAINTGIEKINPQTFSKLRSLGALSEDIRPVPIIETIKPPEFSFKSGLYDKNFNLKLNSEEDGDIFYTLDGSEPTRESSFYEDNKPILIEAKAQNTATIVRAKIIRDDNNISKTVTNTYFMDENIENRFRLPVISISTDESNLFDKETGIYTEENAEKRGREWQRPIHIEYFKKDGELAFEQNAGVRIHGGATRSFEQKTLRLYASSEYDKKEVFNYQIFKDKNDLSKRKKDDEFKRLLLRNSGNDWTSTMFRDAMLQSLVEPFGTMDTQSYQPSILYINGKYWGIHNIREKYDEYYLENTYGVDKDKVSILEGDGELSAGDKNGVEDYNNMIKFIKENGVSEEENYDYIKTKIDIENFRDYFISQTYFANQDWPHSNISFWKLMTDSYIKNAPYGHDGRWRWMLYDTDHGFARAAGPINEDHEPRDFTHNTLGWVLGEFGGWNFDKKWPNFLIREMMKNEDFKIDFLNRYSDILNSYFLPETVKAKIDEMESNIEGEMPKHIKRWNKIKDMKTWHQNVDVMRNFADERPFYIRKHLMDEFNIDDSVEISIKNNPKMGNVRINSIVIDKNLPRVDSSKNWSGIYFKGIPIRLEALAKKGYQFSHWEGVDSNYRDKKITVIPNSDKNIRAIFQKE